MRISRLFRRSVLRAGEGKWDGGPHLKVSPHVATKCSVKWLHCVMFVLHLHFLTLILNLTFFNDQCIQSVVESLEG